MSSATCAFVGEEEFWWFPIGLQLPFGPFWLNVRGGFRSFVLDSLFVEKGKNVYLHGENNSALFGSEDFSTPVFFVFFARRSCTRQCPVKSDYEA